MTDNELIAEWLGAKEFHKEMVVGDIVLSPDSGKFFAIGYVTEIRGHKLHTYRPWSPLTDITLWHGDDGLLAEIETRGLRARFYASLLAPHYSRIMDSISAMAAIQFGATATPAQLTAALVKMIKAGQ